MRINKNCTVMTRASARHETSCAQGRVHKVWPRVRVARKERANQLAQALVAIAGALSSSSGQSQRSQDPQPNCPSELTKPTCEFSKIEYPCHCS